MKSTTKSTPAPKATGKAAKSEDTAQGKPTGQSKSGKSNKQLEEPRDNSKLLEFFVEGLKDIYWAEKNLVKATPKLMKAATSQELRMAFEEHLTVTENQVERLEQIFEMLGKKAVAKKCEAMDGLIKEANGLIEETEKGSMVRDVALICAEQKVEHYEIATYGSLKAIASILGETEVADLLESTLNEEKEADMKLTEIAESFINEEALSEDED